MHNCSFLRISLKMADYTTPSPATLAGVIFDGGSFGDGSGTYQVLQPGGLPRLGPAPFGTPVAGWNVPGVTPETGGSSFVGSLTIPEVPPGVYTVGIQPVPPPGPRSAEAVITVTAPLPPPPGPGPNCGS